MSRDDIDVDARLRRALAHAPDAAVEPPATVDEVILRAAHAAVRRPGQTAVVEPTGLAARLKRWWANPALAPALAVVALSTVIVSMWTRHGVPSPAVERDGAPDIVAQAPTSNARSRDTAPTAEGKSARAETHDMRVAQGAPASMPKDERMERHAADESVFDKDAAGTVRQTPALPDRELVTAPAAKSAADAAGSKPSAKPQAAPAREPARPSPAAPSPATLEPRRPPTTPVAPTQARRPGATAPPSGLGATVPAEAPVAAGPAEASGATLPDATRRSTAPAAETHAEAPAAKPASRSADASDAASARMTAASTSSEVAAAAEARANVAHASTPAPPDFTEQAAANAASTPPTAPPSPGTASGRAAAPATLSNFGRSDGPTMPGAAASITSTRATDAADLSWRWRTSAADPQQSVDAARGRGWIARLLGAARGRWVRTEARPGVTDPVVEVRRGELTVATVTVGATMVIWVDADGRSWEATLPADVLEALRRP